LKILKLYQVPPQVGQHVRSTGLGRFLCSSGHSPKCYNPGNQRCV
jgi:hypothetical protein